MSIKYIKEINRPTKINVLIPAAGMGRRMKSYGPKSLIQIKHQTSIIDHQLKMIKKFLPNADVVLVCGFEAKLLMDNTPEDIIKIENENFENTNVVRSLGLGLRACKYDVFVLYGDLIFNENCIEKMNLNKSSLLVGKNIMREDEVGCIYNPKNKLEHMMYDLEEKWGQMAFFKGNELKLLKKICWEPDNYNLFGFEAINEIIKLGGSFNVCSDPKNKVVDIDCSKDLKLIKEIV